MRTAQPVGGGSFTFTRFQYASVLISRRYSLSVAVRLSSVQLKNATKEIMIKVLLSINCHIKENVWFTVLKREVSLFSYFSIREVIDTNCVVLIFTISTWVSLEGLILFYIYQPIFFQDLKLTLLTLYSGLWKFYELMIWNFIFGGVERLPSIRNGSDYTFRFGFFTLIYHIWNSRPAFR